jgi:hypothetical protein
MVSASLFCECEVSIHGCVVQHAGEVQARLPCVTNWPRGASSAFYIAVRDQYFSPPQRHVNRFQYCILLHKAETLQGALEAFSMAGAFATHVGRSVLLEVIGEARAHAEWCKTEVLDELARYATYAFVLDGTVLTCGPLHG